LIGTLAALGVVLLAASPDAGDPESGSGSGADGRENGSTDDGPGVSAPEDLSFLCEGDYGSRDLQLDAGTRDRAQEEVERFVLTAYGNPGADAPSYEHSVRDLVVRECFWDSPAGSVVNDMEEIARAGGKANAPSDYTFARELVRFEVDYARQGEDLDTGTPYTRAVGTAVWVSEEPDDDPRAWQEDLELGKSPATGGDWKVISGQTIPPQVDPEYESYLPSGLR
jgi:hypothetical protein